MGGIIECAFRNKFPAFENPQYCKSAVVAKNLYLRIIFVMIRARVVQKAILC